jgi:hypothetical protein
MEVSRQVVLVISLVEATASLDHGLRENDLERMSGKNINVNSAGQDTGSSGEGMLR